MLYRNKKIFGDYTLGNEIEEYHYYEDIQISKGSIVAQIRFESIYRLFGKNIKGGLIRALQRKPDLPRDLPETQEQSPQAVDTGPGELQIREDAGDRRVRGSVPGDGSAKVLRAQGDPQKVDPNQAGPAVSELRKEHFALHWWD